MLTCLCHEQENTKDSGSLDKACTHNSTHCKSDFQGRIATWRSIRGDLIFLHGVLFSLRDSIEYQLHPARYTKLFVDSKQMVLDGMLAHAKFG